MMTNPRIQLVNRVVTLMVLALSVCGGFSLAAREESDQIKVGIYDFEPVCTANTADQKGHLFNSLLKAIATEEGWTLNFVPGSYTQTRKRLESADIDLMLAVPFCDDAGHVHRFQFGHETVFSTWAQIYVNKDLNVSSLIDLDSRYVGVVEDDSYNVQLRSIIKRLNIDCEFVEFREPEDIFKAIEKGWVDAGAVDRLCGIRHEATYRVKSTPIMFSPIELRFAANGETGAKILKTLDYELANQKKDPNSRYSQLLRQIFPSEQDSRVIRNLTWGLITAGGILLLLGIFSIILTTQVKHKTIELSSKNRELENEVTMRRDAETALRESHELLEKTFSSMHDGLLIVQFDTQRILNCNRAAADLFGYSEPELMHVSPDSFHVNREQADSFYSQLQEVVRNDGYLNGIYQVKRKDGDAFPAEIFVSPINDKAANNTWVIIIRDITERMQAQDALKKSELRLQQAQKMEAIGTLAGGIAHDFNNVLTPIIGFTEMTLDKLKQEDLDEMMRDCMENVLKAAYRARKLIRQILEFSRQSNHECQTIQLSKIVIEVVELLQSTLPATIETKLILDVENDYVYMDTTQLHQIILNICTNAAHAMRETGGKLEISVANFAGTVSGWTNGELAGRDYLVLSIKDNGHGMTEEIVQRIFDPFFTTKKVGEGTGMGLAVVHGIVQSYGGCISVESQANIGTTFYVYLPKLKHAEKDRKKAEPTSDVAAADKHYKVLFIDDEKMIGDMVKNMGDSLGCDFLVEQDSRQALQRVRESKAQFDLVITDHTMPALTGLELAREMKKVNPDLPIILTSGYCEEFSFRALKENGIVAFLEKPFDFNEFATIVRKALTKK